MNFPFNSLSISSTHPRFHQHNPHCPPKPRNHARMISTVYCSFRRHHRRRRNLEKPSPTPTRPSKSKPSEPKLQMVIDMEQLSNKAPVSVKRLLNSSELKFNQFLHSGTEAFKDLQTLITIDSDHKVVISCHRSTVQFLGNLVISGFLIVFALRLLLRLGLGFGNRFGYGGGGGRGLIRRRDRSLGGREVVVGKSEKKMTNDFRESVNPLSPDWETAGVSKVMAKNWGRRKEDKLPNWWRVSVSSPLATGNEQEYQREANRLIRAIMDYRMSGKDISEDDIIQLRRICRTSGVRVFIEPTNARDSFFRTSIDFVLNICGSVASQSAFVQIDGEDAREFIAGLAYNIGLENIRAARMVAAAVAARTRSWLLQAWALDMQGKHSEAVVELAKLCLTHKIFPPEECSPEMEMVARGLEKHLKVEQREYLMNMIVGVCNDESCRSLAEALGLMLSPEDVGVHRENKYT